MKSRKGGPKKADAVAPCFFEITKSCQKPFQPVQTLSQLIVCIAVRPGVYIRPPQNRSRVLPPVWPLESSADRTFRNPCRIFEWMGTDKKRPVASALPSPSQPDGHTHSPCGGGRSQSSGTDHSPARPHSLFAKKRPQKPRYKNAVLPTARSPGGLRINIPCASQSWRMAWKNSG